jgi:hypothetical protein
MNILLIYPQYPDSFWSFKHVMKFISKKATVPPLGLITVSAMLPLAGADFQSSRWRGFLIRALNCPYEPTARWRGFLIRAFNCPTNLLPSSLARIFNPCL